MKKTGIIIIGIIVFIVAVIGVSYSFFVYNKDIASVSLTTGDISINLANINGNLSLSNVIPKSDYEGINSTDYIDFTVNGTVDTERIYYEVYILPKSGNNLNTAYLKTYLTDQTNNPLTSVTLYSNLINSQIQDGKAIYRGLIDLNNDYSVKNTTKNFRLRLWLDENYPDLATKTFDFDVFLYAKNVEENYVISGSAIMSLMPNNGKITPSGSTTAAIVTEGNGTLSCETSNSSIATCGISGTTLTVNGVGVGTATITVNQTAGTWHSTASSVTYSATVKNVSTMSLSSNSGTVSVGNSASATITTTGDGLLKCSSSNIAIATCSISGTTLTVNGVGGGSATITVSQDDGATHLSPTNVSYTVTVNRLASTMSLSSNSGTITVGQSTTSTITTTGDGELNCSSSNTSYATCSISGRTLTINGVAAGSATITVSQTAGITHLSPTDVTYSVTVAILTIASCEGCEYVLPNSTSTKYYYSASNSDSQPLSTRTTFANNSDTLYTYYTELVATKNKNYFLGFKFDGSGNITNAYACGIKGTDKINGVEQSPSVNVGTPFCIEGSTDGSTFSANSTVLNDSTTGIWQGRCRVSGTGVYCDGFVGASAQKTGNVSLGVDDDDCYCRVSISGYASCY